MSLIRQADIDAYDHKPIAERTVDILAGPDDATVEHVARAIADELGPGFDRVHRDKADYLDAARLAIAAMAEVLGIDQ